MASSITAIYRKTSKSVTAGSQAGGQLPEVGDDMLITPQDDNKTLRLGQRAV